MKAFAKKLASVPLFLWAAGLGFVSLVVLMVLFGPVRRVVLWVLLGLLGLLLLLLVVPVTISARYYRGEMGLWVRVLCFKVRVLPLPEGRAAGPKKEKTKPEKTEGGEEKKREKPKKSFGETFAFMKRLAGAGLAAGKVFLRHMRIYGVRLVLPVYAGEAGATAQRYGQLQAAIGALRALLDGRLHVHYKQLRLIPDYANRFSGELFIACKLGFCPVIIIPMGFTFLKHYLRKRPYSKAAYKRAIAARRQARAQNGNGGQAA